MLTACWSVKGGSGTTVVATALSVILARSSARGALLVDLAGDIPAVLGLSDEPSFGVLDWLSAGDDVGSEALSRLEVSVSEQLSYLPCGRGGGLVDQMAGPIESDAGSSTSALSLITRRETERERTLARVLAADPRPVVVDCGSNLSPHHGWHSALAVAQAATVSLLVLRPCYLAVRRALQMAVVPSGIVMMQEAGRSLQRGDLETVLGVPVRAIVEVDPAVARAVDAGVLASRLPRSLARSLRHAA
jgi:cellulose biosynthesis protein BcsQ